MLDKSVPYAGLFMRRPAGAGLSPSPLPDGFAFSFFEDGDESDWARIETSVLEFDSEFAALLHFKKHYMPHADDLRRRCLFVSNADGSKVATSMAWWHYVAGRRRPWVHWVAVEPRFQGLGIGKAIVSRATQLLVELEGDVDFFLKTQTWSHRAVRVYMANGYEPTDEKLLYKASKDRKNNYRRAMRILGRIWKP
jgi:GNAT superfamily N-acetyltransferase